MSAEITKTSSEPPAQQPTKLRPVYEIVAIRSALKADEIAEGLIHAALYAEKDSDRLAAKKLIFDLEHRVRTERRAEEDHISNLKGEELDKALEIRLREILELPDEEIIDEGTEPA